MKRKARYSEENWKKLEKAVQEDYVRVERDGEVHYLLDVEESDGFGLDNVIGLKTVLQEAKEDRRKAREANKLFEGLDPVAARAALETVKKLESGTLDDKTKALVESQVKQITEKFGGELKTKEERLAMVTKALEEQVVTNAALSAIVDPELKGNPDLLLPIVTRSTKMVEVEPGKFEAHVFGADGKPLVTRAQGNNGPMGIKEYVGLLRKEPKYAPAFAGTGSTGGGSNGSENSPANNNGGRFVMTSAQAKDVKAYRSMREQAAKVGQTVTITD